MATYTPELPRDKQGAPMTGQVAPVKAVKVYSYENSSASSVITVSSVTTTIEIAAITAPAVMRWVPSTETAAVSPAGSVISAVSGANFDHVIPVGTFRRFVIPIEKMPQTDQVGGSVLGINVAQGLYQRFAIKSIGTASIMATEY